MEDKVRELFINELDDELFANMLFFLTSYEMRGKNLKEMRY